MYETTSQRVEAVAAVATAFARADLPARVTVETAIAARTEYTPPVVAYALDRLTRGITRDALRATIEDELGSLDALDGFVARRGRPDVWHRGVARAALVASDTTIGVALPALVFALCANVRHVVVKDRDDGLIAAFVATLASDAPELAARVDVATWHGDDEIETRARVGDADVVVAYGGDDALVAIRRALAPNARFVPFGHRTSVGYVSRETIATAEAVDAVASALARDALLYDGEGCLSPHVVFVERGAAIQPRAFAARVAAACDATALAFPAGERAIDPRVATYVRRMRFRASQGVAVVHAGTTGAHVVVYEEESDDAPPLLPRVLALAGVDGPGDARTYFVRHALPLEAFARAAGDARDDVERLAHHSGAARFAFIGTLQDPPLAGDHGGEGRILPFVRAIYRA